MANGDWPVASMSEGKRECWGSHTLEYRHLSMGVPRSTPADCAIRDKSSDLQTDKIQTILWDISDFKNLSNFLKCKDLQMFGAQGQPSGIYL